MSAVTAVSQRYTECGSGVRKWCDGGQYRCHRNNLVYGFYIHTTDKRQYEV